LYIVYQQGGADPEIISTKDNSNSLAEQAFYMKGNMSVAESQGKLYVAWVDPHTAKLTFGWADTNAGIITSLNPLGVAKDQGTDGTPAIAASPDGSSFFMGWLSKDNPARLNFVKLAFPPNPNGDLVAGFGYHSELAVKTTFISIAMLGKTPYVAFEVDKMECEVVKFSEDGRVDQGGFSSGAGCRAPSLAVVGNALYLVCRGIDDNLHLLPVVLDGSGTPTKLGTPLPNPNNQYDEAGAVITPTSSGLRIVYRDKKGRGNNVRIGTVSIPH